MSSPYEPIGWRLEYSRLLLRQRHQSGDAGKRQPRQLHVADRAAPSCRTRSTRNCNLAENRVREGRVPADEQQGTDLRGRLTVEPDGPHPDGGSLGGPVLRFGVLVANHPPTAQCSDQRQLYARAHQLSPTRARHPGGHFRRPISGCRIHHAHTGPRRAGAGRRGISCPIGLPPTLVAPVNFYGASITLQNVRHVSLVLIGVRNSITFTVFNVVSDAILGTGGALPPALQFGQNNTQTGVGVATATAFRDHQSRRPPATRGPRPNSRPEARRPSVQLWNAGLTSISARPRSEDDRVGRCQLFAIRVARRTNSTSSSTVDASVTLTTPSRPALVRNLLRLHRQAVPAQSRPGVLLRQPAAQARDGLSRVRRAPERGLHRHHRRGRRGQDHDRAQSAREARSQQGGRGATSSARSSTPTIRCAWWRPRSGCAPKIVDKARPAAGAGGIPGLGVPAGKARPF